jgi:glutaconate CoA-transferase subunit B
MYLAQIHPRVSVDDIKEDIPWDLKVASDLTETTPPTEEEINFIRRFAPTEVVGRQLMFELGLANIIRKTQR